VPLDDRPVRGHLRLADYERVSHGLFQQRRAHLTGEERFLRELRAWRLVLPPDAVFTHLTGARILGWRLPELAAQAPVFASVDGDSRRPRRPGLLCSRLVRRCDPLVRHGLPVDRPEEILLRAARDLGTLDLVILVDSALASGDLEHERLDELLTSGRPGVRNLRAAYSLADRRSESAGETLLRLFHRILGIRVTPQVDLHHDGRFIARADLVVDGTPYVHEYDGAHHRSAGQHRSDLRRERRLVAASLIRRGFTLDDLLNHGGGLMHELDRALDRPHVPDRLAAWRALVENSLYAPAGRARLTNRWRRAGTIRDWPSAA
jgi:hypothetical protein